MKSCVALLAAGLLSFSSLQAAVIAQWNFNSPTPDADSATGTLEPSAGSGSAVALGAISSSFAAGDTTKAHDPAGTTDNSGWQTAAYPAVTNANKTVGIQFSVDTRGYQGITLSWYERHSGTASRFVRVQYTVDGAAFVDADVISIFVDSVFTNQIASFAAVSAVADNPRFAFRLVTEFEQSATGVGTNAYVATKTGSTYGPSGTVRYDMVTVSGTPIPGANTPPFIAAPSNQVLRVSQSTGPLPFTVGDAEDSADNLLVSARSSAPELIPDSGILLGGTGTARTVSLSAGTQPGTASISLAVLDTGGRSNQASFTVTVLPANTPPAIAAPPRTNTLLNLPTPAVPFTVGDLETPAESLLVSASSANPSLLPDTAILLSGTGSNRTVTLTPAPGQAGVAPVTLTVSDGALSNSTALALVVTPAPSIVAYEPFAYPDGSVVTNSGFLWDSRSGTLGECEVTRGRLLLSASRSEDVGVPLVAAPYAVSNGCALYAAFKATFLGLPKNTPDYFAHFVCGSSQRARIYAGTTNAAAESLRLFIANGTSSNTIFPLDLRTNVPYTLVTRYVVDTATATLWVDPASETAPAATAQDPQEASSVSAYAFRESSGLGTEVLIDDLKVGLSFEAVLPGNAPARPPLLLQRSGGTLSLSWTNAAFSLQAAPAATGLYTNIPDAVSPYTTTLEGPARFFRLSKPFDESREY